MDASSLLAEIEKSSTYRINMDIDPNTPNLDRKYPSIKDYYRANVSDASKPMQLQKGLSNFSGLLLGDDRIAFSESILSGTYRVTVEDKMAIPAPSLEKTLVNRKAAYHEAQEKVGDAELNRLERVMKDKLFQRSYMTSSPFQVNKAFKFFDREQAMRIHIEGFTRALEFLGFQFSELQNMALFARYDPDCKGTIDYMNFIAKAMFYGTDYKDNLPVPKNAIDLHIQDPNDEMYHVEDIDDKQLRVLQDKELQKIFDKVDRSKSGKIDRNQLEFLLLALGQKPSLQQLDSFCMEMGLHDRGHVTFECFSDWWRNKS